MCPDPRIPCLALLIALPSCVEDGTARASSPGLGMPGRRSQPQVALAPAAIPDSRPPTAEPPTPSVPDVLPPRDPEQLERERTLSDTAIPWDANPTMVALGRIAETLNESTYSAAVRVDETRGSYEFDCSGLVGWVLRRSAPRAHAASHYGLSQRALARDFQRSIARAPTEPGRRPGWQRVERVADARPGDVVAWIKPAVLTQSPNTGHVAFVAREPYPLRDPPRAFLVRVIDSTRLYHDNDTREAGGGSGFGMGTLMLLTDEGGAPVAYSWVGTRSRSFETAIAIGRPLG